MVLAVAAQLDREYGRGLLRARRPRPARGNHGGRPKVIDDDMLTFAAALRDKGVPMPEIALKLTIKSGKNAGKHPSVASLYQAPPFIEAAATPSRARTGTRSRCSSAPPFIEASTAGRTTGRWRPPIAVLVSTALHRGNHNGNAGGTPPIAVLVSAALAVSLPGRPRQIHAFFRSRSPDQTLVTAAPWTSPWLPPGYEQNYWNGV